MTQSFYELLEIPKTASQDEIKKAYRKMALKYHPDRNPDDPQKATEMFQKIEKAYSILTDDDKRRIYDQFGEEGLENGGPQGNPFGGFGGFGGGGGFPPGFPFEVFGNMFGGVPRRPQEEQKQPIIVNVQCTLAEVYSGAKRNETYQRELQCNTCDKTGFADSKAHPCGQCNGTGKQTIMQQIGPGMAQQFTRQCGGCRGSGNDPAFPVCGTCSGGRIVRDTVRFDVEIRRGIRKGNRMVISQMGHQNRNGTFSDLIIVFDVADHPRFVRKDNHLFTKFDISLRKALLGFKIGFEHIDGKKIVIRTEDIIQPGAVRKIPGLGLVDIEGGATGDLYIQFNVVFPSRLNSKQLKALDIVFHKDPETDAEKIDDIDISRYHTLQKTELGTTGEPKKFYADIDDVTEDFSQAGLGNDDGANIQCAQQ